MLWSTGRQLIYGRFCLFVTSPMSRYTFGLFCCCSREKRSLGEVPQPTKPSAALLATTLDSTADDTASRVVAIAPAALLTGEAEGDYAMSWARSIWSDALG